MQTEFKELSADIYPLFREYANKRDMFITESQFINQFIWSGFYNSSYYNDDKFLFLKVNVLEKEAAFMPLCKKEDIITSFNKVKQIFNEDLKLPLKMYLVDEEFVETLMTNEEFQAEFEVEEYRDAFDYIYDAEKLRTLSGKQYHKKKNHVNNFKRTYEGRYEYRRLCCSNVDEVRAFHTKWLKMREVEDANNSIDWEEYGVNHVFQNCSSLNCRFGGVYIDGNLEAYTIGSYDESLKCAFIHIEKANPEFNGLYNFINQHFLINEYPDAEFVNREDDLGQEGLRKSKLSYKPIRLEKKFIITQKNYK